MKEKITFMDLDLWLKVAVIIVYFIVSMFLIGILLNGGLN
jgi:hypothetical protein